MRSGTSIRVVVLLILFNFQNYTYAQPSTSPYLFEHFDTSHGLLSNFANAVIQDSLGFIWFLHDNGLTRYDGYTFKAYPGDSIDHLRFSSNTREGMMILDTAGNVWLVNQQSREPNKRLTLTGYEKTTDSFRRFYPNVNDAIITCALFGENEAQLFMGSFDRGLFAFNTATNEIANFFNASPGAEPGSNTVFFIVDQDSVLLLATPKGLWTFDKKTKRFSRPYCRANDTEVIHNSPIVYILQDKGGGENHLWLVAVGEKHQLIKVNEDLSIVHSETHSPLDGEVITVDRYGSLWFTTNGHGLYKYDPQDSVLSQIGTRSETQYSLRSNFLRGILVDRDQNIWVTTTNRGVTKIRRSSPLFHNYPIEGEVTGRAIKRIKNQDYLFISRSRTSANSDNDLLLIAINPDQLSTPSVQQVPLGITGKVSNPSQALVTRSNNIFLGQGTLWVGSWHDAVVGIPLNAKSGLPDPQGFTRLKPDPDNPNNTLSGWSTTALWEDENRNLWVGTRGGGLNKIDLKIPYGDKGSVTQYRHVKHDSASVSNDMIWWNLWPRDSNSFYLITASGIDLFENDRFHHFFRNKNSMTLHQHSSGRLFIGTTAGLFEPVAHKAGGFRKISIEPLDTYGVSNISEDGEGRLWITNLLGLVCYDLRNGNVTIFTERDDMRFSHDWIGKTSSELIITSDAHGFTLFDPRMFQVETKGPRVLITNLLVKNQNAIIADSVGPNHFTIDRNITILSGLTLDHRNNHFTLEFSAMEFNAPEKNRYRYKLEGYDDDWIETDWKSRTATYTNLTAGEYTFKVKASNHHGVWSDRITTLGVVILPPPWKSWWAYTIYALILLTLLWYWRGYEIRRIRLKQRAEHLTELDRIKTQFFSNISHEFRTPVTLILGPLKELDRALERKEQKALVSVMIRNAQRLLRLINQLLDLSKLEAGKMRLQIFPVEIVSFLREIVASYESLAAHKQINFFLSAEFSELTVNIDKEKIEKVVHNLLSNAFKFTVQGSISLTLRASNKNCVEIIVRDTGAGIPTDQINKVFDRFFQVDNSQTREHEGSGIGMALAKELVELHHGTIIVESTAGKGTTFTVSIPRNHSLSKSSPISSVPTPMDLAPASFPIPKDKTYTREEIDNQIISGDSRPLILVVEDNLDMRAYIKRTLLGQYQIAEATDGKAGISQAQKLVPDLIISDIMMPEMDGYKFCELIKSNELTSHIPVILLTAKADRDSKLEGLETGADDYLSKPFDTEELKLFIRNRIEERRKMRERFSKEVTLEPKHIAITSLDEKFLRKVLDIIEIHMDDERFSVVELSAEAGYSHMQFYRKLKALTGLAPNQFLRTIRLKRSAELLRNNSDHIAQIAYSVGFGSESYFIKCFKEQYGMTPGQFSGKKETPHK